MSCWPSSAGPLTPTSSAARGRCARRGGGFAVSEPALWQRIQLFTDDDDEDAAGGGRGGRGDDPPGWRRMARAAVDRSAGRCESFRGRADMGLLAYLAARLPSLRAIRVTSRIYVREEEELVAGVIPKLPLLERLELSGGGVFPATTRVMRALLGHSPALEVLDAGGCATDSVMSRRVRERMWYDRPAALLRYHALNYEKIQEINSIDKCPN
uniref:FBD domain-containing protein n=1 Tax=Oryza glumipatula TaxID=40148 RepID=A0A0E0ARW9_9ORYZ